MRVLVLLVMIAAPFKMVWSQEMNRKFSLTTQIFLDEQQQKKQLAEGRHRAPARRSPDGNPLPEPDQLVASPDTIGGVVYISCIVHLNDVNDLSAVQALGVRVQSTFKEFITANVPVEQLNALADIDNVTMISVAQLMRPSTDVARRVTNAHDLLTQSASAAAQGVSNKYDGTGVVLGIIDTGIDFQHIAFKDKDGNSRIKRAYVYDGTTETGAEYTSIEGLTTDDTTQDHGTHTASTAGGSSVIVNRIDADNYEISVTDNHASATYGGMAPGADLYLAGVKGLKDSELMNALQKMVEYAHAENKPLVVSNSWGSDWGPRDGTGELASVVSQYFGGAHPNRIILFSSANNAGRGTDEEGGGFFVKKTDASTNNPLGTILRTRGYGGNYYQGFISLAYSDKPLMCRLCILDNKTGECKAAASISSTVTFSDGIGYTEGETTTTFYTGKLNIRVSNTAPYYVYVSAGSGLTTTEEDAYTLAIQVYPADENETGKVNMWAGGDTYFTSHLTTPGYEWTSGTDDMSVSDEATIPDAISVGAYVSRSSWYNYENNGLYSYTVSNREGDIARFSSYATAEMSPTGKAYPWISGPGQLLVAGVNHYHTKEVDNSSYFGDGKKAFLVVNNANNPYAGMQGTSMSCPAVAGIVAQWLQAAQSVGKDLTVNDVKDIMRRTAINDAFTTTGANATHFGQGKIDALAGIQYITGNGISLADNAYNDTKINRNAGTTTKVMLYGRTLWKDGGWNTLCLPFSMTAEQIAASGLAGADIRALSSASFDNSNGELTLNFTPEAPAEGAVTEIVAGTPYIIKWASSENLVNPSFTNVTISSASNDFNSGNVSFIANYDPVPLTAGDRSILFMGGSNTLYYPGNNVNMGAFRAHFKLNSNGSQVKQFVLNFDGDSADGLSEYSEYSEYSENSEGWYDLSGRKMENSKLPSGIYIHNGKKVVIK